MFTYLKDLVRLSARFQPVPAHLLHVGQTVTTVKIPKIKRAQWGRSECSVMLPPQSYHNGNSLSLQNLCPTFCQSPCDSTIKLGDCLPRPRETKRFLQVFGAEGATVTHRDSSGKQKQRGAPADRCWRRCRPAAH